MPDTSAETLVRQIVHGERDWSDLSSVGILVIPVGDGYEIVNANHLRVLVGPRDVARGIVRLAARPDRLASWASLLMAGSLFLDLDLSSTPGGEELLNALWDLSSGTPLADTTLAAARAISTVP